jgi:hypothetical protein
MFYQCVSASNELPRRLAREQFPKRPKKTRQSFLNPLISADFPPQEPSPVRNEGDRFLPSEEDSQLDSYKPRNIPEYLNILNSFSRLYNYLKIFA